ncbi:ent-copalyl diphosphate synthase, chloroplastic-like [Neltuma alba]|uniref:ent-copalyl diphosphate synthase, chloroplastic-like n=1 Tax=Neltuma alba TaxID=207710 RepID=UPI0010A38FF6|nr:ent-copalyl diphosphate synthase, chloroplastic-like [Prosopis alba]
MASQSTLYHYYSQSLPSSSTRHDLSSSSINPLPIHLPSNNTFPGASRLNAKVIVSQKNNSDLRAKSTRGISEPKTSSELVEGLTTPKLNWKSGIDQVKQEDEQALEGSVKNDEIRKRVESIRKNLESKEGEKSISPSAYHTALFALVEDVNGSGAPQFPESLQWLIENQLPDGSWGDADIFVAYDRLLCTLASVIVLTHYNVHPEKVHKGLKFFKENANTLETENREHMTCGFEVILPTLLHWAKGLNMDLPDDFPGLPEILARRDAKLKRIPMEVLHSVPTTLLFSLEAIPGLQWDKLQNVRSKDGSYLFCPSSTAFAFTQSNDPHCLTYLNNVAQNFNGGVPDFYPIEFFEQLWIVDRLERLGIARYFQPHIKEILDYVHRNWNERGIGWTKDSDLPDLDDTSMGFRLLRLNGYDVSPNVFKTFEKDGEFCCLPGQTDEGATVMFNFYRATQFQFPEETILYEGRQYATNFLSKKRADNQILDKWIIAKDLPGEVSYALDFPWYASLPRVETRFYLDQYGGGDDVWISKTLYRLHKVSNNDNLELGKLDYNKCQSLHRVEWNRIQQWYSECGLEMFGLSKERLLLAYFLATANIFEPERSQERLAWVKTSALIHTLRYTYPDQHQREAFVHEFNNSSTSLNERWLNKNRSREGLFGTLIETLHSFSQSSPSAGFDILHDAWKKWLLGWQSGGDQWEGDAELLVNMINLNAGYQLPHYLQINPQYHRLLQLSNQICHQLSSLQTTEENNSNVSYKGKAEIGVKMQELVQLVLSSNGMDLNMKKTFLTVTKSFYYAAHTHPETVNSHIEKVLFERVA